MECKNCGAAVSSEMKECPICKDDLGRAESYARTKYFSISIFRLVFLGWITGGIYLLFWFYKNWQAVKKEQDPDLYVIPRSIFTPLFCYDLFKRIGHSAKNNGYLHTYSASWIASGYIILQVSTNILSRASGNDLMSYLMVEFFALLVPLTLIPIQRAINFNNAKVDPEHPLSRTSVTPAEVLLVAVAAIVIVLAIIGSLQPAA